MPQKRQRSKPAQRARKRRLVRKSGPIREAREKHLRDQLLHLLGGGNAHAGFERVVEAIPAASRGAKPAGQPFTLWQLLEHLRIAQWDILEFSRDPKHVSPAWPQGYWPDTEAPPDAAAWESSVAAFRRDLKSVERLARDPATDLYARIPWGTGQNVLREVLLVADHNAYHLGQMVLLRRLLGIWSEG